MKFLCASAGIFNNNIKNMATQILCLFACAYVLFASAERAPKKKNNVKQAVKRKIRNNSVEKSGVHIHNHFKYNCIRAENLARDQKCDNFLSSSKCGLYNKELFILALSLLYSGTTSGTGGILW